MKPRFAVVCAGLLAACAHGEQPVEISGEARTISPTEFFVTVGCYEEVRVEVDEGPEVIELRGYGEGAVGGDCGSIATVTLEEPLDDRQLVDARTGRTIETARAGG